MKTIELIFKTDDNKVLNVIQLKDSQNSKIGKGIVIQTYHFSMKQVISANLDHDKDNCLNCPLSKTNGYKLGKCYTHKGLQKLGLNSMLKRLNKIHASVGNYNESDLDHFISITKEYLNRINKSIDLVRFGAYGEPVFLGEFVVSELAKLGKNITGYTHTYKNDQYNWSNKFFMASTHNNLDKLIARSRNFRQFNVILKGETIENSVNCPASVESGKKTSCINCSLCSGNYKNLKKDIHILQH